ncbi:pilus assembly protein FimV [Marinobacter sp. es.048]|uniref:FimV/HubP family polar landmark protein n=1 Tax=Marinobacter sp. es.048 TaxID=1761795 RepID=UPI000B5941D9|nr:FimV/HubP family polar landmark protein [Marinobacter sp. es.048]SNC74427.1 pilus assembly protein FimV [Marinobacter sp. es.048]
MKVRKLAVALALAGGLGSGVAQALGLGEIELQSYLNEPLDAEIVLRQSSGVNPADVFVNIASEQAYERVGLDRNQFLSKLRFQVVTGNDGSLIVNVSSREPLREPYLNFLLELTWPSGRLMREYAVLVDPPVYAEESGVQEQVSTPTVSTTQTANQPTTSRSAESVRRQAQAERSLSTGYQADTFGPTGASDTLWTIASRMRPDSSVSMQQVMLAIQDLNPNAFMGNNINRLKRGEVLRVPSLDQIQSRTRAEATRLVAQQNQEFQSPQRTVDATAEQQPPTAPRQQADAGGDELKLVVSEDTGSESSESGSAGGDSELPGGVDAGTAVAMEELESARRENDELNSRVEDLQDQVQTLQRLLELKNTQLAEMQQTTGDETAEQTAPVEGEGADLTAEDAVAPEATAAVEEAAEGEAPVAVDADMTEAEPEPTEGSAESTDMAESEAMVDETEGMADSVQAADDQGVAEAGEASEETGMADAEEPSGSDAAETGEETVAAAPASSEPGQAEQPAPKAAPQAPAADKGFPGNVIDAITGNPMYQIALGGGLILLLLLLLLLARRNANREKAFYDQLNKETDEETDSFDLSLDEEDQQAVPGDALMEADSYIAYGQHDQAAQTLETAISREPSRSDLRLKLLGVYADTQDRESFEKQFGEIEALEDEEALTSANELRTRLEEAESMPSIDDLESQLRSDSFATSFDSEEAAEEPAGKQEKPESEELLADQFDAEQEEPRENEFGDFDSDLSETDLSDFELDEFEEQEATKSSEGEVAEGDKEESRDDMIEYDLSGLELESDEEKAATEDGSELEESGGWDLSSEFEEDSEESAVVEQKLDESEDDLSLDLEEDDLAEGDLEDERATAEPEAASEELAEPDAEADIDSLDESFLDELDAELDKVAGEEDELGGSEIEESSLDDLELDVSDEDLALMEEFSDSADSANTDESEEASLDEELGLEDTLGEGDAAEAEPEQAVEGAEELEQQGITDELEEPEAPVSEEASADEDLDLPVASDEVSEGSGKSQVADIEESELGDEDDFDFLAGTDEAATKLDLARAYIEMGDSDGARDILEEVALEGNEDQKAEAQDLLKNLS